MSALTAWCEALERGADRVEAARSAAQAVRSDPWRVVEEAGPLARARPERALVPMGLTRLLRPCEPDSRHACHRIGAGALYPAFDTDGRRARGAFDTPRDLARQVIAQGLAAAPGAASVLDPACGTGALLVAAAEQGVRDLRGWDLDAAALAVAAVALPGAHLEQRDGLTGETVAELVVGNPPFVPPERQPATQRRWLKQAFPWLTGRYDLAVPFAAHAGVLASRAVSLLVPASLLSQPYGEAWRRRWLARHRITALHGPLRFPGVSVDVVVVSATVGEGPAALPWGLPAAALCSLPTAVIDPALRPGDLRIWEQVHACSAPLGELCEVDTGLVAHSHLGPKSRLLHDAPGPGRVPFADARDFFAGKRRWLEYGPDVVMHRAKRPELFEGDKLVLQRLKGRRPLRVSLDRSGTYVGHTCIVARPLTPDVDLSRLRELLESELLMGVLRIGHGPRLDLYPRVLRQVPVPRRAGAPEQAWALTSAQRERLLSLGRR